MLKSICESSVKTNESMFFKVCPLKVSLLDDTRAPAPLATPIVPRAHVTFNYREIIFFVLSLLARSISHSVMKYDPDDKS